MDPRGRKAAGKLQRCVYHMQGGERTVFHGSRKIRNRYMAASVGSENRYCTSYSMDASSRTVPPRRTSEARATMEAINDEYIFRREVRA